MNAVWAVFSDTDGAERVVESLQKNGFMHSQISMVSDNHEGQFMGGGVSLMRLPQVGPVAVEGSLARTLRDGSALKGMERWGMSPKAMQMVMHALQNGGSLVAIDTQGDMMQAAEECLHRYSPLWSSQAERNHMQDDRVSHALMQATDDEDMLMQQRSQGSLVMSAGMSNSRHWASG